MKTVSTRFLEAIGSGYKRLTRVTALPSEVEIPTVSGDVNLDIGAAVLGTADLEVLPLDRMNLASTTNALAPYGNELFVEQGIAFPDGTTETIPLGKFIIDETERSETAEGARSIRVSAMDRSYRFQEASFEEPLVIEAGTNFGEGILMVLQNAWPDVPYVEEEFENIPYSTPLLLADENEDRWDFAQGMAEACGRELLFDGLGQARLRVVPGNQNPIFTVSEGRDGVLVSIQLKTARGDAFNRVIVTGENTGNAAPVRGVATDVDPSSPTYYYGPFGHAPRFYSSENVTSQDQAKHVAATILAKEMGVTQSVSFGSILNPALEPRDAVRVKRSSMGVDEDHILDSVSIPLSGAVMSCETRARRIVLS